MKGRCTLWESCPVPAAPDSQHSAHFKQTMLWYNLLAKQACSQCSLMKTPLKLHAQCIQY
jgi:hypothetical protein